MANGFVRLARPGDAADIARIQLTTWRTAYRRLLPRRVLADLDEAWMTAEWREAIEAPPSPRHRVLIAVEQAGLAADATTAEEADLPMTPESDGDEQSHMVGFVATGPADDEAIAPGEKPLPDGTAAVTDLLVEPRWGRRGHGSRLLSATVDLWRENGFETAVAWAYQDDPATRAFLTSAGWEPDGATRALDVDDLLVPQVRLHVSLAAA